MRTLSKLLIGVVLGAMLLSSPAAGAETVRPEPFAFNWAGAPTAPQPWTPQDWDVVVHSRDINTWGQIEPIAAGHGADCAPPPATHMVTNYEDSVYVCKNHMMTAINAGGYGVIYFAPNRLIDFSAGTASVKYRVSTQRDSLRDWHDIWITPFDDNLVLPLYRFPDLQGPPRNAVHIQLVGDNTFIGHVLRNFESTDLPKANGTPYDALFGPSATSRTFFELDISRTHIRFGMPEQKLSWIDTDIPDLGFTQGVVQLGHHSYNPTKAEKGKPGTWHWSEFSISSSVPFTMLRGDIQSINASTHQRICFPAPATSDSHLRFAGVGTIEVSFDGGRNFVLPQPAAQIGPHNEGSPQVGLFTSYWTPIPQGTRSVVFRGTEWWGGPWWVRDPAIWSRSTDASVTPAAQCLRAIWAPVATVATKPTGGGPHDSPLTAFLKESELLAGMRMAGTKNLMLLGLCFVIALAVAGAFGFGMGRRRRRRAGRRNL